MLLFNNSKILSDLVSYHEIRPMQKKEIKRENFRAPDVIHIIINNSKNLNNAKT